MAKVFDLDSRRGEVSEDKHREMCARFAQEAFADPARPGPISTGIRGIDERTPSKLGLAIGSVTLVSGSRLSGKTSLAVNTIGLSAAIAGRCVRIVAPDSCNRRIFRKALGALASVPYQTLLGQATEDQAAAIVAGCDTLAGLDMRDMGEAGPDGFAGKSGLLVFDDLEAYAEQNEEDAEHVFAHLGDMAEEFECAIVAVTRARNPSIAERYSAMADLSLNLSKNFDTSHTMDLDLTALRVTEGRTTGRAAALVIVRGLHGRFYGAE
jgi:hypothetical protein